VICLFGHVMMIWTFASRETV